MNVFHFSSPPFRPIVAFVTYDKTRSAEIPRAENFCADNFSESTDELCWGIKSATA